MFVTEDVALGRDTLYRVVEAVAQGPDPARVLPAIADLLAEATGAHGGCVYLREGGALRLRAASRPYAHRVGRVVAEDGVGGLAPGASLAAPLPGPDGEAGAVGIVVVHAEEDGDLAPDAPEVLAALAALVAGPVAGALAFEAVRAEAARHAAVARQQAVLLARLDEEHLVRDLFDALAEGRPHAAEARARGAGHDLGQPHVVAVLEPLGEEPGAGWPETAARVEARLRHVVPGALCDPGEDRVRALLPVGASDDAQALARLDAELDRLAREERLAAGRGEPRSGLTGDERGLAEATSAAQVARAVAPQGGARGYGTLGVYRYLAQLPPGHAPDERHAQAIATLAAYDAKRRTELLGTLERHLGDRGALAATARALYIHTNTLRQRLDRIETLTGLDLATEDLLSLELALKLARLHGTA